MSIAVAAQRVAEIEQLMRFQQPQGAAMGAFAAQLDSAQGAQSIIQGATPTASPTAATAATR